jgi:hypothetical protein
MSINSTLVRATLRPTPASARSIQLRFYSAPPSSPQASIVRSKQHEGLTYLQLDRAKAKNALSVQMVSELRELIEQIRFDGYVSSLRQPSRPCAS